MANRHPCTLKHSWCVIINIFNEWINEQARLTYNVGCSNRLFIHIMRSKSFSVQTAKALSWWLFRAMKPPLECPQKTFQLQLLWKWFCLYCISYLLPSRSLRRTFPFCLVLICLVWFGFSKAMVIILMACHFKKGDFLLLTKKIPVTMVMSFLSGKNRVPAVVDCTGHQSLRDLSAPATAIAGVQSPASLMQPRKDVSNLTLSRGTENLSCPWPQWLPADKFYSPCRTARLSLKMVPGPAQP